MVQGPTKTLADWRSRLQCFQRDCEDSGPREQADRIREANYVFSEVAKALGRTSPSLLNDQELEGLLAAHAYESASLALLDSDAGVMLSRGSHGVWLATVVAPGAEEETAEGSTLALAVLIAQSSVLLAIGEGGLDPDKPIFGNLANLFAFTSWMAALPAVECFEGLAA